MVEPGRSEGRGCGGGCGSGVGWVAASAIAASSASYASANLSPLPAAAAAAKIAASSYHQYPAPLAKYEDVVPNPKLFMDTLEKLHACMRTKFMIPIIGGKELDLHQLFVEVTSRGGIEKILREKKWKEVTAVFNFPSTATNASFVLRKYYYSLLQHYEQIYYFKAQGWTPLPAGSLQSPSVVPIAVHGLASMSTAPQCPQSAASSAAQQPSTLNPTECAPPAANAAPSVGSPVVGVIDGKFESGYLVTVTIGTEKLKGVLYQAPSNPIPVNPAAFPSSKNIDNNSNSNPMAPPAGTQRRRRRRRKKSEIRKRDPAHPKPNRSGYNFFFAEQHARLKPHYPGKDREISRMIGELWTNLKDNDKSVYQEKALEDKERYRMEMERYRERLKASQVISDAVPLRQRLPDLDANMVEVDVKEEDTATRYSAETPEIDESESSMSEDEEEEQEADTVGAALGTGASDSNTEMSNIIGPETKVDMGKTSQEPSVVGSEASQEGPGDVSVPGEGKQNMVPDCEKDEPIPPPAAMT